MKRPWCCPEPRCMPVHQLGERAAWIDRPFPGSSFLCFGQMETPVHFIYDGTPHANDLRSCSYTPLKGVVANQENADDWRAISNAYKRALDAIGGWDTPSIEQDDDTTMKGDSAAPAWPVGDDTDDVTECGSCGSPNVYFDPADGWSCNGCGRNDSDG